MMAFSAAVSKPRYQMVKMVPEFKWFEKMDQGQASVV